MNPLLAVSSGGARTRNAISSLEADGEILAAALKRAVPFLGKSGGGVIFAGATSGLPGEAIRALEGPDFVANYATNPGGSRGQIAFDATTVGVLVDGVLGGGKVRPTVKSDRKRLSAAQTAFMRRVSKSMIDSLGETLAPRGITLTYLGDEEKSSDDQATSILVLFDVVFGDIKGRILLAVSSDVSQPRVKAAPASEVVVDPRVAAVVNEVEIELAVELGRVRIPLSKVTKLEAGMTLLVDTSVGGKVIVRSGRHELLRGTPTTGNGQIAIRITEQAGRHAT